MDEDKLEEAYQNGIMAAFLDMIEMIMENARLSLDDPQYLRLLRFMRDGVEYEEGE